jgi:hypothetical protein
MLGATLAVMFPGRVERLVVDGCHNVHEYTDAWYVLCPHLYTAT